MTNKAWIDRAQHMLLFFLELRGMPVRKLLVNTKPEMIVISGIHFRLVSSRIFFKFFAPVWLYDNFILNQIKIFCVNGTKRGLDWTLNPPLHIHTQLCSWIQNQQSRDLALMWQLLFLKSDNNTDEYEGSYSFFAVPTCLKHYWARRIIIWLAVIELKKETKRARITHQCITLSTLC